MAATGNAGCTVQPAAKTASTAGAKALMIRILPFRVQPLVYDRDEAGMTGFVSVRVPQDAVA